MKKHLTGGLAVSLLCALCVLTSCKTVKAAADKAAQAQVVSTELIRTSQSWDGMELPDNFGEVFRKWKDAKISGTTAAARLGVSHSTFYRWAKIELKKEAGS